MDNKKPTTSNEVLTWEAEEFQHHPKTAIWYIGFTVVAAGLLIFAFTSSSLINILLFAIIVITAFIYSHRRPRAVLHQLTPTGIMLGDAIYPYKNIKKFWIIYEPPTIKTLNIETTAYLNPHVLIQLGHQDPVQVKLYLIKYLPQDLETDESMIDVISRKLKI